MRLSVFLSTVLLTACAAQPVRSPDTRTEMFTTRFAEHENLTGPRVQVVISGNEITVSSLEKNSVFEKGLIASGELAKHTRTGKWIIAQNPSDVNAPEVGGCTDGPLVVDLEKKIFWTC